MEDFEYISLRKKGSLEFKSINHSKILEERIKNELPDIISFLKQPRKNIREFQINRISKIVDYAYEHIPLYRKKYDKIGYKKGSIKTFEDFQKLPILYKEELIDGFPEQIVKDVGDFKYSTRSSGSSGKFVTLSVNVNAIHDDTLQGIRQFLWQSNYEYKKTDRVLFIYTCPWWISQINGEYIQDFLPTTTSVEDALDFIKKTKPLIISTYPTYLQKLCSLNTKLSIYGVKYIIVHSEQSTKKLRDEMAKILDVTVFDEYSSEELTRIALECKEGHYHLEEDACYIEVLDPVTKTKINKGTGLVVGTNLINLSTPIIRYHQGDLVTIDEEKGCCCGNNGRIISEIQGREMDCIISNGKSIPASAFMDLAYNWFLTYNIPLQALKYQIVQKKPEEIDVCLMKGLYNISEKDIDTIEKSLYTLLSPKTKVKVKLVDEFIFTSNKFKPVINVIGEKYEKI